MSGELITLAHGSGGGLTRDLIKEILLPLFDNPQLAPLSDAALIGAVEGPLAVTTDAFVVDPIFFPGGNLGELSISGTINDLVVSGAKPVALTWALVIEEGLEIETLRTLAASAAKTAREAGVAIMAGDTKVVPRGKGDGIFAVSSGMGRVVLEVDDRKVQPGDLIILSGTMGDHGSAIMAARHNLRGRAVSDVASLLPLLDLLVGSELPVHTMHDPTRGGVGVQCHETAARTGLRHRLFRASLPLSSATQAVCDLLGLDPLYLACEGRALVWLPGKRAEELIALFRKNPLGKESRIIGRVEAWDGKGSPVIMETEMGIERPVDYPSGLNLPRIC